MFTSLQYLMVAVIVSHDIDVFLEHAAVAQIAVRVLGRRVDRVSRAPRVMSQWNLQSALCGHGRSWWIGTALLP